MMVGTVLPRVLISGLSCRTCRYWSLAVNFSLVTLSHGVLDAFTDGGLGIAGPLMRHAISSLGGQLRFLPLVSVNSFPLGD
jgi:hypothetical protein